MSRQEKLLIRFLSVPNDFTWDEIIRLLSIYGYEETKNGKTGGSRRKFVDADKTMIILHKPHPSNVVKTYVIRQMIDDLKTKGYIKDE